MAIKFEKLDETERAAVKPAGSGKAQIDARFATPIEDTPPTAEDAVALPFGKGPKSDKKARSRTR